MFDLRDRLMVRVITARRLASDLYKSKEPGIVVNRE